MTNPWTKKNPLMSMWLSAANKAAGSARAQGAAAVKREVASSQADVAQQILAFWAGSKPPARRAKTKRR